MTHRLFAVLLSLLLLTLTLPLASCGSDSNDSSSPSSETSSASPSAMCDTMSALSSDVGDMTNADNVAQFQTAYNAAKKDFADLKPAASASYGNQVDAVGQAMSDFGTALKNFGNQGALQGLQDLGNAAGDLDTAVKQLATDLPCPSSSSS